MKIIFSPAKEMNLSQPQQTDWEISKETAQIVETLKSLSKDQLKKQLKVSDKVLEENLDYIAGFDQAITYPAIELYHGLAYRQLQLEKLSPAYLDQHVRILSALYGPIAPSKLIKPYRLDFNMGFKLQGQSLKQVWKPIYNQAFQESETIINLASQEFSSLLKTTDYNWIDVDFYEVDGQKEKRHSTISKKGRGLFLSFLAENEIVDLEEMKAFNRAGYQYDRQSSTAHLISFKRQAD